MLFCLWPFSLSYPPRYYYSNYASCGSDMGDRCSQCWIPCTILIQPVANHAEDEKTQGKNSTLLGGSHDQARLSERYLASPWQGSGPRPAWFICSLNDCHGSRVSMCNAWAAGVNIHVLMTASMRTRSASTTSTRRILDYMFKRSLRANDDTKNIVDFSLSLHALDIRICHMVFSCVWGIQISSREVFACLGMYHEENALFMILNDILFFFNVFFMDLMYLNGGARMS